ncbi:MAG: NAD(P)/FAD-dependent oxidoreductase [Verrucomicrobiales bacterium]
MTESQYDVVIIGGAYSGASAAILLKRAWPDLRVLLVESRPAFDRKVGESTSDVAGCFLTRVLRQHGHLINHHLPKQGLRFWFTTPENIDPARCSEMGTYYQVRLPTFQVDRSTLDEHLLATAVAEGCQLWRPARVKGAQLGGLGANTLDIEYAGTTQSVRSKWVIDASGKAAFLARKMGSLRPLSSHPTNSMWVRFRGVKDLDTWESHQALGTGSDVLRCPRMTATNHLTGRGWWCWIIPLKGGDLSAGLTWDTRLFSPPEGGSIGDRLKRHLCTDPIGRLMFVDAEAIENDSRMYSQLPYFSEKVIGQGWAIIGDAAGFMDPLYSQGLDYCSHTAYTVHKLVGKSLSGHDVTADISAYEKNFQTSYQRWYQALYQDKYHYLGDADLMWAAFLLDLSTYFMGPVSLVYNDTDFEFSRLPYYGPIGGFFAWGMRFYNRRLVAIAQKRWAAGTYGRNNLDRRFFIKQGFAPEPKMVRVLFKGLWAWLKLECQALFLRPASPRPAASPSGGLGQATVADLGKAGLIEHRPAPAILDEPVSSSLIKTSKSA